MSLEVSRHNVATDAWNSATALLMRADTSADVVFCGGSGLGGHLSVSVITRSIFTIHLASVIASLGIVVTRLPPGH